MEKYKTVFKLKVFKSYLAGQGGTKLLSRQWSVPEEKIRTKISHYRLHGLDGFRPKRSAYRKQFKPQVLAHEQREQLSSRQIAAVYNHRNHNQVVVWRRNPQKGGLPALGSTKQGHPTIKPERRSPALSGTVTADPAQGLLEERMTDITEFNVNGQKLSL